MIDMSEGADQPFHYETASHNYYVLCNGEIYNYQVLIEQYDLKPQS
jgi:asparagine synthetase B (glutamine-hydrolysing)